MSVVSLLNEPNTSSPANVDASVMFRRWKDSKGKDKEYENIIRYQFKPLTVLKLVVHTVKRELTTTMLRGHSNNT